MTKKAKIFLSLFVTSIFLFQNCATLFLGKHQKIPVTSRPSGAIVIVDGEKTGYTPINLKLIKKKQHTIRIEMPGYRPLEIRLTSRKMVFHTILSNFFLGGFVAGYPLGILIYEARVAISGRTPNGWGQGLGSLFWGFLIGWAGASIIDLKSGKMSSLSPKVLDIMLNKIEGNPQPLVILMDSDKFQNIKWIRIKLMGSEPVPIRQKKGGSRLQRNHRPQDLSLLLFRAEGT